METALVDLLDNRVELKLQGLNDLFPELGIGGLEQLFVEVSQQIVELDLVLRTLEEAGHRVLIVLFDDTPLEHVYQGHLLVYLVEVQREEVDQGLAAGEVEVVVHFLFEFLLQINERQLVVRTPHEDLKRL